MIPESHLDLFERPILVALITIMPDGQPQATPIWCSYDGEHLLINTVKGRRKYKNMVRDGRVTVLVLDPDEAHHWIEVRGEVVSHTEEGAIEHINQLSASYRGIEDYYTPYPERRGNETRVIFRIKPMRINLE